MYANISPRYTLHIACVFCVCMYNNECSELSLYCSSVQTLMSVLKASILACRHIQGALTRREDLGVSAFRDTSRSEIVTADVRIMHTHVVYMRCGCHVCVYVCQVSIQ